MFVCSTSTSNKNAEQKLPFDTVYDIQLLKSYYSKRKGDLANRIVFCAGRVLRIAAAWKLDEVLPSKNGESNVLRFLFTSVVGKLCHSTDLVVGTVPSGVRRGKVLRDTISGMGPVFVKLGQV
jgi:predicted unusual protein kinase regulating ubiquinone biosynthesis (AarF/ABC1/UbiB family)